MRMNPLNALNVNARTCGCSDYISSRARLLNSLSHVTIADETGYSPKNQAQCKTGRFVFISKYR